MFLKFGQSFLGGNGSGMVFKDGKFEFLGFLLADRVFIDWNTSV
jgi:hypothetical protein